VSKELMTTTTEAFDVIILGAGAAGLMCALTAGQRGRKVLLLDHADKVGAKILISGGGRCNFTNLHSAPDRFLSGNTDFCKSALGRYTQADFISLVERHHIPYHEKTLGQLFCDGSARAIVTMLLAECTRGGVDVRVSHTVTDISHTDCFRLETTHGCFTASTLVLATGGLSIPKMGATGFAYDVARRFGLGVTERLPGLVPLKATPETLGFDQVLAGVSLEAIASCAKQSFRESILFTHRGLSGPAILQISSYWRQGDTISLDLTPAYEANGFLLERKRSRPRAEAKTVLAEILPARLAHALAEACLPPGPIANVPDRTLVAFAARLKRWEVQPTGSEEWSKAEVTLGGIDTRDLSSKTMEARDVPGLYAIGEALDVTGWLGGYNFQWAWSSGWCAGQAIS
jgi:predicted Rossmann fold flavoprotein